MREEIHPVYREVVIEDVSCGWRFLTRSTTNTKETTTWEDGKTYPLLKVDISSRSHPFFTGAQRAFEAEGQVQKFLKKYQKK